MVGTQHRAVVVMVVQSIDKNVSFYLKFSIQPSPKIQGNNKKANRRAIGSIASQFNSVELSDWPQEVERWRGLESRKERGRRRQQKVIIKEIVKCWYSFPYLIYGSELQAAGPDPSMWHRIHAKIHAAT